MDDLVGTYQGQWLRGMRHGYGVRASAPFGLASHYKPPKQVRASLTSLRSADGGPAVAPTPEPTDRRDRRVDDSRGGFVLKARSDDPPARRKSLTEKSLKKGILSVRYLFLSFSLSLAKGRRTVHEIIKQKLRHFLSKNILSIGPQNTKAEEYGRFGEARYWW